MIRYDIPCGALIKGKPCGNKIDRRSHTNIVCSTCESKVLTEMFRYPANRAMLLDLMTKAEQEQYREQWAIKTREDEQRQREERRAARRAAAISTPTHVVYYAKLGENHIKIGTTGDLPARMSALRVVNRRNLLAAEPGGFELEHQRHDQFKAWRWKKRTEDFADAPSLMAHIRKVRDEHGDPWDLAARLVADQQGRGIQSA